RNCGTASPPKLSFATTKFLPATPPCVSVGPRTSTSSQLRNRICRRHSNFASRITCPSLYWDAAQICLLRMAASAVWWFLSPKQLSVELRLPCRFCGAARVLDSSPSPSKPNETLSQAWSSLKVSLDPLEALFE